MIAFNKKWTIISEVKDKRGVIDEKKFCNSADEQCFVVLAG